MPLRHIPIDKITENDLEALVKNQIPEGKTIDYKGDLNDKYKEFARDISSFANTIGGDIVFGIEDNNGIPTDLVGLDSINVEQEITKFHQWMQAGIEPKIPGITIREIELSQPRKTAIVVRIPRSWSAPHMVTAQDDYRFFWRHDKGKLMMGVSQVRDAFEFTTTTIERIRNFRKTRLQQIASDKTPVILLGRPRIVLHVIPLYAFDPAVSFDVSPNPEAWTVDPRRHTILRFNLDGFIRYFRIEGQPVDWYQQTFRNGVIEFVTARLIKNSIPAHMYEKMLIGEVREAFLIQQMMGVEPPLFVMLTLCGVKDYELGVSQEVIWDSEFRSYSGFKIDRNNLEIPEIMVEDLDVEPAQVMRPLFDAVWNAAGWPRSLNYSTDGKWIGG